MGVGATRRLSAVRWGVTRTIAIAWLLTFPVCGLILPGDQGVHVGLPNGQLGFGNVRKIDFVFLCEGCEELIWRPVLRLIVYIVLAVVLLAFALKVLGWALVLVGWLLKMAFVVFLVYLVLLLVKKLAKA